MSQDVSPAEEPAQESAEEPADRLADQAAADLRPLLAALELPAGGRATLVLFSSAFCAPCRATRRVLAGVAQAVPDVAFAEVDAELHLALVRRHDIRKTPTTIVLDGLGREVFRAAGQPATAQVLRALP